MEGSTHELAGRGLRFAGNLLDTVLTGNIAVIGWFVAFWAGFFGDNMTIGQALAFPSSHRLAFSLAVFASDLAVFSALNAYLLAKHGQTIGKRAAETRIIALNGDLRPFWAVFFVRYVLFKAVYVAAWSIPVAGILFPFADGLFIFRKDRRCLHDLIAGTRVVTAFED